MPVLSLVTCCSDYNLIIILPTLNYLKFYGAGEIAQWLTALVLTKDLGSVPNTHMQIISSCNYRSRSSDALFWPLWHQASMYTYLHTAKALLCIKRKWINLKVLVWKREGCMVLVGHCAWVTFRTCPVSLWVEAVGFPCLPSFYVYNYSLGFFFGLH